MDPVCDRTGLSASRTSAEPTFVSEREALRVATEFGDSWSHAAETYLSFEGNPSNRVMKLKILACLQESETLEAAKSYA